LKTHVEFTSDAFPATPGEEEQINPGRWGRLLADYLRGELSNRGFSGPAPFAEDWGWAVEIENAEFRMFVGCGNLDGSPAFGVAVEPSAKDQYLCFIEPSKPFVRRLFHRIDTIVRVTALSEALESALVSHPRIRNLRWWPDRT
jgi:hypothetical protein